MTCVLGRNGVGKTSLLRAIFGLNPIRSGHIRWEDRDLTGLAPHDRARAGLALVPQGREIFPRLSVLENLRDRLRHRCRAACATSRTRSSRCSRC